MRVIFLFPQNRITHCLCFVKMCTNKDFYAGLQLYIFSVLFKMVFPLLGDFLFKYTSILCKIIFVNKHWSNHEQVPLKRLVHDWQIKFVYNFFLTKTLYISSVKPYLMRMTIFKLIVHGIELRAAFEERENKLKNAKFLMQKLRVLFLCSQNCIMQCLYNVTYVTMFTNRDFQLCLLFNPFKNGLCIL